VRIAFLSEMQKYLHVGEKRRILERSTAASLINSIKEKTMKIIRACLLVAALACPVFADDIPYGVTAADDIPNGVMAAGEIQNGVTVAGDIPFNVTAAGDIPYGVPLLNLLLILL
jgi:hypothetical protein